MARCRCQEGQCACSIVPGANIQISGSGQADNPWVVSGLASVAGAIRFEDNLEVQFETLGFGTVNDPLLVTATLPWVQPGTGNVGDVLTKQPDATWAAGPPPLLAADGGSVATAVGLSGDGSAAEPLRVHLCTYGDLKALSAP